MRKKADISMNMIVMAVLALTVLIILIFIFKNQIGNISGGFMDIGEDAREGASGTKCRSILGGRACKDDTFDSDKYKRELIPKPCNLDKDDKCQNEWSDCGEKDCFELVRI